MTAARPNKPSAFTSRSGGRTAASSPPSAWSALRGLLSGGDGWRHSAVRITARHAAALRDFTTRIRQDLGATDPRFAAGFVSSSHLVPEPASWRDLLLAYVERRAKRSFGSNKLGFESADELTRQHEVGVGTRLFQGTAQ